MSRFRIWVDGDVEDSAEDEVPEESVGISIDADVGDFIFSDEVSD